MNLYSKPYCYFVAGFALIGLTMLILPFCSLPVLVKAALAISLSCGGFALVMYSLLESYGRSMEDETDEINDST
jgi:hypothetical protein